MPRIRDHIITSSRTREARRGRRTSKGTGSRPSARGILSLHTANTSLCIARCASGRQRRRSTVPTLNGRRDPAPRPGVDLATLRFARPTPTESPSTASGLAGFPESSPQQIAPDTPASVLRARSCAAPRAGLLGSRGSLVLGGWAGVARSKRWHRLSQEDPQSTRFIVARIGQCFEGARLVRFLAGQGSHVVTWPRSSGHTPSGRV